jgi:hypothetical protein
MNRAHAGGGLAQIERMIEQYRRRIGGSPSIRRDGSRRF